jgi:hypothetical protein
MTTSQAVLAGVIVAIMILSAVLLTRRWNKQEKELDEQAAQEWKEMREAYLKKTGKEAPRYDTLSNRLIVFQEIDPEKAEGIVQGLKGIANFITGPDERTPEEIRRDIERERLLAEEMEVKRKLHQDREAGGDKVVDDLKGLREEEEQKLLGVSDPVLIREIRMYYRAKRMEVLRGGK